MKENQPLEMLDRKHLARLRYVLSIPALPLTAGSRSVCRLGIWAARLFPALTLASWHPFAGSSGDDICIQLLRRDITSLGLADHWCRVCMWFASVGLQHTISSERRYGRRVRSEGRGI